MSGHLLRRLRAVRRALLPIALALTSACGGGRVPRPSVSSPPAADAAFLDMLERRTFDFFWETTNPRNGLAPDRWPQPPFASIAAVGFALTAYPVGVERGWITRAQAAERTRATLRFFLDAPRGPDSTGVTGHMGFYYHFLNMESGLRHQTTELSTIDTALLLAGVLFCQSYYDGSGGAEPEIRAMAESLYRRAEWPRFLREPTAPLITMAWRPERGYGPAAYRGYDEAMILYVLALGSPTHPVGPEAWTAFTSSYDWGTFYGQEHVNFAPLFGHQYSHVWIDFRGIRDAYMRGKGIDYFENSRRATLAQRAYAAENPGGWRDYGADVWGLTASDGPGAGRVAVDGREVNFRGYWARGAALNDVRDDGTLAPTALGGSIPFAPDVTVAALRTMAARYGEDLYARYGFLDAFNPTLRDTAGVRTPIRRGRVVLGKGWFDDQYLGIDQGPIVSMIANHRTELIWTVMKRNAHVVRGLCRAGFTGGWLEGRC